MRPLLRISAVGTWGRVLPGVNALAAELGAHSKTVQAAVRLLETEGWLKKQGVGRARLVRRPRGRKARRPLRVAILDYEPLALTEGYIVELQHLLMEIGHAAFFTDRCLLELGMDLGRVARLVRQTEADAWVLGSASREVLEWFIAQGLPAFALFGQRQGLPIAGVGPDKAPALAAATRRLIELGHRRIVLLTRQTRRLPQPERSERAFLDELAAHGIRTGSYNLPDCGESVGGFRARLDSLFQFTPPTALIVDEAPFFFATMQFLMDRGLRVPQDVSLVCTDHDRVFAWSQPAVAHIAWDSRPVVRQIVRWANNVARGQRDVRQSFTPARFVPGGTIGPAPVERFISPLGTGIT